MIHEGSQVRLRPSAPTLAAAFQLTAASNPDRPALRSIGGESVLTWAQYARAVERAAGALAGCGVARGDRVALLSRNRPELAIADVASLHLGAATVGLYPSCTREMVERVLADSAPSVLIAESALAHHVLPLAERHRVRVVPLDGPGALSSPSVPVAFDFDAAWRGIGENDLATVLYTSGTTGEAKGVEHTHAAALGWARDFDAASPETGCVRDVSFAPFANAAERAAGHWRSLIAGSTRTFCLDPTRLGAALSDARPTFLFGSPRLWQSLLASLDAMLDDRERRALDEATARLGTPGPWQGDPGLDPELRALRARIGLDRLEWGITAGAPCPLTIHRRARALGLPLAELYGTTESGGATLTRLDGSDIGSVGRAIPGWQVRVASDGEVLVRSRNSFRGYRSTPDGGKAAIDAAGWIQTGDLGELDEAGRLRLRGRRSELVVPEHGHNVAPGPIETDLKAECSLIAHACIVGNGRPHLAALVVLESPERPRDDACHAAVSAAVARLNDARDPRERIEAHAVLPEPWRVGEELTETLKLRRAVIEQKYAAEIESLYRGGRRSRPVATL